MRNVWVGEGLAYWQIPRCAGTSIASWLEGLRFLKVDDSTDFHEDVEHFTVMRDPFHRYVSCLSLVWEQTRPGPWPEFLARIDDYNLNGDGVWNDDDNPHFLPQTRYLEKMPDATLFDITELGDLGHWLREQGVDAGVPPHARSGSSIRKAFADEVLCREPIIAAYEWDYHILD